MQQVYTPRVKGNLYANDSPQKPYYGKTAPRFNLNNPSPAHKYFPSDAVPNNPRTKARLPPKPLPRKCRDSSTRRSQWTCPSRR
jgi:hypothetical protein